MAQRKKRKSSKRTKKQQANNQTMAMIITGFSFIFLSLLGLFKLGFLGILFANILRFFVGNTYPLLAVILIFYGIWLLVKHQLTVFDSRKRSAGLALTYVGILVIVSAMLFAKIHTKNPNILGTTLNLWVSDLKHSQISQSLGGGMIGGALYQVTYFLVAQFGSYVLGVLSIFVGVFLFTQKSAQDLIDFLQDFGEAISQRLKVSEEKQKLREEKKKAKQAKKEAEKEALRQQMLEQQKNQVRPFTETEEQERQHKAPEMIIEPHQMSLIEPTEAEKLMQEQKDASQVPPKRSRKTKAAPEEDIEGDDPLEFSMENEEPDEFYELPPSTLLDPAKVQDQSDEYEKIKQNGEILNQTFQSFGVDATVVKASLGPSVTKFEIQPAVGVKVSKIVSLTDDIALALAAKDIRMEAPIPGKSLIGIEVPNQNISMVSFREVIEATPAHPDKILEVPLGRDISGKVQTCDLTKMPHLLIAGSTGSGKSVAINGIITSILMQAKPHQVKLMMVDPKMVELNVYNGIPHLLTPVVTNPRKAAQALQKVVKEMEERYEKFAATGVRNIAGYNELIEAKNQEDGQKRPILPFIVVIVDELADLMMVASTEVEDAIIRLAQMARAAGIHMILATQRPSVDVITGIIKANVPSRIAFAVSSGTDSRTIIDSHGAEKLLGRGDMLYLPMGENKPIRVQGAFISDGEVERIVKFVTDQMGANYDEKMMNLEEEAPSESNNDYPQDELYEEAKALVVEMQTASVSLLQRRFRIGYNRAARLVDELEANGVVGPSEGSKPRKVYLESLDTPVEYDELPQDYE